LIIYDSVRWDYLWYMMNRIGFSKKWAGWMKGCVESPTTSILVNESLTLEFHQVKD